MPTRKAIFFDRDGTLNQDPGYVHKVEDYGLLPGVIEGLSLLKDKFVFFIITNQSGIGRGYYSVNDFHIFNNHLLKDLRENGIDIKKSYFCPHLPQDNCQCRKPKIKHIRDCVDEFDIDLKNSWVVGDHPSDIQLGINAGTRTIYLKTGHGMEHFSELKEKNIVPTYIAEDFLTAVTYIKNNSGKK